MRNKLFVYGLMGTMLLSSLIPTYGTADDVVDSPLIAEAVIEAQIEQETIMTLSLDKSIEYALANSRDMEIQRLELDKAKISYDQNIKAVKAAEKSLDITIDVPRTYEVTADDNVNKALVKNGASRKSVEFAYQVAKWNLDMKVNQIDLAKIMDLPWTSRT